MSLFICSTTLANVGDSIVYDNILYTITKHDDLAKVYEVEIAQLPMQEYVSTPAIVPYMGNEYKVTSYNPSMLPYCEECFDTNIPDTTLHVTKIDLSKSIYIIGDKSEYLFSGGMQIDTLILPPNLICPPYIMPFYFDDNTILAENYQRKPCVSTYIVTNPNSDIHEQGFHMMKDVEKIDISILKIDSLNLARQTRRGLFIECYSLKKVKLPHQLKHLGKILPYTSGPFELCYNLRDIQFPETLESIGNLVFGNTKLESLYIPKNVKYLHPTFSHYNKYLKRIDVDSLNQWYESKDGVLYTKGGDSIHTIPYALEKDTLIFPKTVYSINEYAFGLRGYTHSFPGYNRLDTEYDTLNLIRNFIVNQQLRHLGNYAFFYSPVEIIENFENTNVVSIPKECFSGSRLKWIKFPIELTYIGKKAFAGCKKLESIDFTHGYVSTIDTAAFMGCVSLKQLDLSKQTRLKKISRALCDNSKSLKVVKLPRSIEKIETNAFKNCISLDIIEVPILEPLPITEDVFEGVDKAKCKLIVPQKSIDKYRNAPVWKEFFNVETDTNMLCLELKCDTTMGFVEGTGVYSSGEEVIISAIPYEGYDFIGWSDNSNYKRNYRIVTVNSNMEITAFFAPKEEKVKLELNCDSTMGFVVGSGTYNKGEKVEIKATPYEGYLFNGWSDNADITTNEREIIVNSDMEITAYFTEDETKTDVETITAPTTAIQKILRDGQVFIIRDGKTYNIMGIEVENIE